MLFRDNRCIIYLQCNTKLICVLKFDFFWFSNIRKIPDCTYVWSGVLLLVCGSLRAAAPQNREAICGDCIAAPGFARRRSRLYPPPQTVNAKKQSLEKGTAENLLSFKFNEVPCKIDDYAHGNGENHNLDNQVNGNVIVNTVA